VPGDQVRFSCTGQAAVTLPDGRHVLRNTWAADTGVAALDEARTQRYLVQRWSRARLKETSLDYAERRDIASPAPEGRIDPARLSRILDLAIRAVERLRAGASLVWDGLRAVAGPEAAVSREAGSVEPSVAQPAEVLAEPSAAPSARAVPSPEEIAAGKAAAHAALQARRTAVEASPAPARDATFAATLKACKDAARALPGRPRGQRPRPHPSDPQRLAPSHRGREGVHIAPHSRPDQSLRPRSPTGRSSVHPFAA